VLPGGVPQVQLQNELIGAAAIYQARLFNMHPSGKLNSKDLGLAP
jgi:succinate dehydrogenase iron-sulfur subunit